MGPERRSLGAITCDGALLFLALFVCHVLGHFAFTVAGFLKVEVLDLRLAGWNSGR